MITDEDVEKIIKRNMTLQMNLAGIRADFEEASQQQEPVAIADGTFNHNCPIGTLLYTSPPQRQWVGLNDHERLMCRSYDIDEAIARTEAKLKEKNT